jgi:pimeloyl-ACP methyl ester carboxylesterase
MAVASDVDARWDSVRVDSQGTGPDVVVVPGFVTSGWTPTLEALTSSNTIHLVELPGFTADGEAPPQGIRTVMDLACGVKAQLLKRDLVGAPLVGHSFGGWVAAELASLGAPERLMLVDAMGLRIGGEKVEDIFDRPRDAVLDLVYTDRSKAPVGADGQAQGYSGLARFGWNPYLSDLSLPNRLSVLDVPTLVVWGAEDRVVPATHAALYCELISGARSVIIPDAGHDPLSEQPDAWTKVFREFLA